MTARRWWSFAEVALGAAIVIAHNVYRAIPNEVPILVVLAIISFRARDKRWGIIGMSRPPSWPRTVWFALAAAATRILLGALVIDPITAHFWPAAIAPAGSEAIAHNPMIALLWLALVWTFAAFGEEIGYRGYLLNRAAEVVSPWIAVVVVAVLFGFGHYYKGPAGIVDSGMAGLILGLAYVLSGHNLWVCILAHGFIDTFGVIATFFGVAD